MTQIIMQKKYEAANYTDLLLAFQTLDEGNSGVPIRFIIILNTQIVCLYVCKFQLRSPKRLMRSFKKFHESWKFMAGFRILNP